MPAPPGVGPSRAREFKKHQKAPAFNAKTKEPKLPGASRGTVAQTPQRFSPPQRENVCKCRVVSFANPLVFRVFGFGQHAPKLPPN